MTSQTEDVFTNEQVETKQFPVFEQISFTSLSDTYLNIHRRVYLVETLVVALLILLILKQPFFDLPNHISPILIAIIWLVSIFGLLTFCYCYYADPNKGYALRELDLSYKSGLIFQKTVTQPILRIQHVELKRGPIDRKFGLAKLQIFSAGGAMHTFEIPGLELATAENIRQFILSHKDINRHG